MELEERDGLNMFLTRLGKKHVFLNILMKKKIFRIFCFLTLFKILFRS